jgi:hypothetical protein
MAETVPPALATEVDTRAAELVRAAAALYLDGTTHQGLAPDSTHAFISGGMFEYLVVPRHERIYILQVTAW